MAFWRTVGNVAAKIAKKGISSVQETMEQSNSLQEKYKNYDDDKLKDIFRSGSTAEKMAATQILKKNGS